MALAALALLASASAAPLFSVGLAPIDDTATPAKLLTQKTCAACHPGQASEWQHSRHGLAWKNAIFQREYKQQPLEWCVHCHAPLKSQLAEVRSGGGALADEGVTCAVCHVRDGRLIARRKREGSPHDTQVRADFGSAEFCGGCHQFNFPLFGSDGQVSGYSPFPMQNTVAQFRAGPGKPSAPGRPNAGAHAGDRAGADKRCGDCHARSPFGHTFPGAHDPGMLRLALDWSLCTTGGDGGELVLTLRNRGAGHNVPTGDVHRHIVARLWRSSHPERLYEYSLTRRYKPVPGGGKRTVADTTLPPGAARTLRIKPSQLGPPTPALLPPLRGPSGLASPGAGPEVAGARDPLRFELRYVYTIDEFPFRGHELAEPTYEVITSEQLTPAALPACAAPAR